MPTYYTLDAMDLIAIIIIFGVILLSITLHEFAHALMGYWLGDDTAYLSGRLTLNPLAHIDIFTTVLLPILLYMAGLPPLGAAKPVPFNPNRVKWGDYGAALVGAAGPLTNLIIAAFIALPLNFVSGIPNGLALVLGLITFVNIAFGIFNLIPFPPLDGSRVLYAFAPYSVRKFMKMIERYGIFGFALFFLVAYPVIIPILTNGISGIMRFLLPTDIINMFF